MHIPFFLLLSASALHAQVLGGFESFTEEDNASSWGLYDYATGEAFIAPWDLSNSGNPEIYGIFTGNNGISLFADVISSSGYFVGDFSDAGIDTITCDVFIEDVATFADIEFYLLAGGTFYYSDYYNVDQSGWSGLENSLSRDQWYLYDEDDEEFLAVELTATILSDVTEIGLNFYPSSAAADGKAVALDNFALLPDLIPPVVSISSTSRLAKISFFGIAGIQYTLQASPSLEDDTWTNVGSPFEILGPSQTRLPLATRSFFRLRTVPFYIEAP